MGCTCAVKGKKIEECQTYVCALNVAPCIMLFPNSTECAVTYGKGPDTVKNQRRDTDEEMQTV